MAITKIQSESLNLADTYDFTGTVTGAGGGITQADLWRYTGSTSTSNTRTVISADLERADDASFGYIGSGMTQSSGIFTFPETGIYYVTAQMNYYSSGADSRYVNSIIQATTDNSSYDNICFGRSYLNYTYGTTYTNAIASCYIDVTNTSNVKVKFLTQSESGENMNGNTDINETFFTFIRLGDT
nr:filamentous hemagglutinin-like protein [uncultured Mediterranean phage uvMED]